MLCNTVHLIKFTRVWKGDGLVQFLDVRQFVSGAGLEDGLATNMLADLIKQRQVVAPLFINDPLQIVNNIQSPTLILQGKKDVQVTVQDAEFLEEAMKRASHKDSTLLVLDDVDHLLKTNKGAASSASLSDASRPVDAALLAAVTDWLLKKSK